MTDLEKAESKLLHKLVDELRAAVPELGEPTYDSTSEASMSLNGNGKVFTYRLGVPAITTTAFQLCSTLWDGSTKLKEVGWVKTEDSVTKLLSLVRATVDKFLA